MFRGYKPSTLNLKGLGHVLRDLRGFATSRLANHDQNLHSITGFRVQGLRVEGLGV